MPQGRGSLRSADPPPMAWAMSLRALSDLLWEERDLLERLLFRLEEEELVLASGRRRWLRWASEEVETAAGWVRDAEIRRCDQSAGAAGELGLDRDATLAQI